MLVSEIIAKLGGTVTAARRLGVERTAVSMWKKRQTIPLKHLRKIAAELGVPLETLWPTPAPSADREAA